MLAARFTEGASFWTRHDHISRCTALRKAQQWLRNWSSRAKHTIRCTDGPTSGRSLIERCRWCSSDVRLVSCLKHLSSSLTISSTRLSYIIWCRIRHQDLLTYLYNKISLKLKGHCGTGNDRECGQNHNSSAAGAAKAANCSSSSSWILHNACTIQGPNWAPERKVISWLLIVTHYGSCMPLACLLHASWAVGDNSPNSAMHVQQFAQLLSLAIAHARYASSCFGILPSLNLLGIHFQWHFQLERQGVLHDSNQFTQGFLSWVLWALQHQLVMDLQHCLKAQALQQHAVLCLHHSTQHHISTTTCPSWLHP